MTDQPPRRIPEWLSLQDISRAWSAETGESVTAFEERFRAWFKDFLLRNDYGDAGAEDTGISAQMLEGRQIWRETFEIFCEERGLAKPRFWFPEAGQTRVSPGPVAAPAASLAEPIADAPTPSEKKQEKPPPRRRAREGGASFTWIAAGLVVAVVAGLVGLWMQEMDQPIVEREAAGQGQPGPLVVMAPSSETAPAATEGSAPVVAQAADSEAPIIIPPELTAPELTAAELTEEGRDAVSEPVATPAPTTAAEPAAAQVAAALADDRPAPAAVVAAAVAAAATPMPSEPPDEGLILLIQRELRVAGFDPGPLDGKLGTRFAAAISAYQRANGLPASGRPSIDLLSRLARENLKAGRSAAFLPPPAAPAKNIAGADTAADTAVEGHDQTAALKPPSLKPVPAPRGGALVRSIQERLAVRGYYTGPLDGSLGPKTRAAIRTYQRAQRHPATGRPSAALFEELEDYALEARGLDQFRQGAYEAAIVTYSRIIQRKPKYADAYFNRGLAYKNSDRSEQALADYETAIQLDPSHDKAYFDRANIHYRQGLYRDAVHDYFKALTLWLGI